jgi:hypothetical protein
LCTGGLETGERVYNQGRPGQGIGFWVSEAGEPGGKSRNRSHANESGDLAGDGHGNSRLHGTPEQVRGDPTDARSDIFSFGAVLYEMIAGKRAFRRNTSAETMTAILREEPPELNDTGWQGPLGLQRILSRCLERNIERRFQSASDLAFAIESLSGTSPSKSVPQPRARRAWLPWAATALGMLAMGAAVWTVARWSAARPQPKFTRLTYQQGYLSNARFAKDGQTVIYSAQWNTDPLQVYSVRTEFPQSTKVDLPSAALLALSTGGDLELAVDPVHESWFMYETMAQAQMVGHASRTGERGDCKLFGVSLSGKQRPILTTPEGSRLLDVAADGRVLLTNERQQTEIAGIDPATGKERRGREWFDSSIMGDVLPDGKAASV